MVRTSPSYIHTNLYSALANFQRFFVCEYECLSLQFVAVDTVDPGDFQDRDKAFRSVRPSALVSLLRRCLFAVETSWYELRAAHLPAGHSHIQTTEPGGGRLVRNQPLDRRSATPAVPQYIYVSSVGT